MKRTLGILLVILITLPAAAQEMSKKERRKMEKQLKKEQRAKELEESAMLVEAMVTQQLFVLEADQLRDKRGNVINVSSMINFVAIDSTESVVQIGSHQYIGRNGVGGVTIEGTVNGYEFNQNEKNKYWTVYYNIRSVVGSYDVRMTAYPDGRADATVTSSGWGSRVSYTGRLVPPGASSVFQGTSL